MGKRQRSRVSPTRWLIGSALCAILLIAGCWNPHGWVEKQRPWTARSISDADRVRIEETDGRSLTLDHPTIVESTYLTGTATEPQGELARVELANIHRLEVWETSTENVVEGIAVGIVAAIAIVAYVLYG